MYFHIFNSILIFKFQYLYYFNFWGLLNPNQHHFPPYQFLPVIIFTIILSLSLGVCVCECFIIQTQPCNYLWVLFILGTHYLN